ncbi:AT-rich interactive domain-containing protein 2 isoform X3 [Hyalella azteca]|uniref:AT-rich interactive domain-containing protein 2 isoform X3 n=1 Tax=Hyalella azteca TaxID=294128 RepID=A0A8B7P8J4_HYAAZ|nr:AT-rich interactive domain-containing protein 2 isoform X3 [Hyalella azteca]
MSKDNSSETEAYDKEYDAFLKKLNEFHQQRGTPFKRLPRINGKGVDLYLLYVVVTARGGWQKVNARNEWEEILEDFRLPPACVNSSVALKQIYMRYLDTYERVTFLGSDADDKNNDNDEDDASHPGARSRRSVRALNLVPLTYNNAIHNVAESMRASANMCTTLLKPSQYDRLFLSLCSPMPNEHDFSFNLCTLLSNEGRQVMRLAQCPRLLEIMLGHVGVFRDVSTRKYFVSNIVEQKNKNLVQFWLDSVEDCRVLELLLPPGSSYDEEDFYRSSSPQDRQSCPSNSGVGNRSELPALGPNNTNNSDSSRLQVDDSQKYGPVNNSSSILVTSAANDSARNVNSVSNSCRELVIANSSVKCYEDSSEASDVSKRSNEPLLEDICRKLRRELCMEGALRTPEDIDLFHCGRDSGLQDSEGTRIAQLIHILRNLSFEEDNVTTLAQSKTCLRFLVLCMCSRFGGLSIQALDTLGNIGSEVVLADPKTDSTTRLLLWHVCQGVFSEDRARVLRSLEVLNKLAVCDANEEVMGENIEQEVYEQICRYLTIHDIMLLIYTLESLYSLSSLGSASCNAIVRAQGSIHTLVALLTVEAQSYGPEACIGMKVVETVTGVVSDPDAPPAPAPPPPVAITSSSTPAPPPPAPSIAPPHPQPPLLSSVVSTPTLAAANAAALQNGGHGSGGANAINKTPAKNVLDMKKSVMSSAIPADVEEFVCDWIRRSYEAHPGTLLEQAVVFRHFSSAMHALGKKQGFNPVMLSSCFRKVYGFKVGPTRHNPKDASDKWYYHDLRRRDVPLPIRPADRLGKNKLFSSSAPLTNTPVLSRPDPPASVGSSILKAQLSAPLRPISPAPPRTVQPQQPALVSRNMQKQQQQQQQLVCVEGDTNGTLCNDSSSVDTSINGVTINGEPAKMEEELVGAGREEHEVTSFEGILQNGLRDTGMSGSTNNTTVISVATDTEALLNNISVTNNNNSNDGIADGSGSVKKNVLADLLEKTVGGDILNGVVDKEIRLCNGPLSAGVNNVNNSGGLKRPGADDFDDCGGGTKRLAIDRGDGKITLYVSQNGDGSCDAIGGVDGSGAAPQQVVFSGQSVANIIAVSTPIATQRQMNSTQGQLVSSQGQLLSSQGQLVTSQGQLVSSQGQLVTTQGQLITSQGQMIASGPQLITSTGQLISSTGQLITSGAQLVTSTGQLIPAAGQLMTTQNGQKVVVQGGFPQVIGGQVVLSQGGHLVVGGNTSGGGGETVLLGGQVLQQNASGSGTQVIGNTGQMLAQGPQQVLTSNTGHIIAQGQGALLAPAAGTGHVITQGQIIAQPQILQSQGQIISQGSNQILGASAGQIITTPSGQIVGQVTQAGQILGQINQAGQIVGQVNQAGQIVGQVNQAGQIVGQVNQAGQIVGQVNQAGQIVGQVNQAGQIVGQVNSAGQIVTQGSAVVSQGGTLLVQQSGTSGKTLIILPPGQKVLQQPGQQQIVMQPQTVGGAPILQVQQTPVSGGQVLHQQQTVAGGQVLQVVTNSNAVSGGVVRTIAPSSVGVIPASNSSLLNSNGGNQGLPAPVATAQSSGIKHPVSTSGSMTFVSNRGPVNSSSNNASSSQPPGPMVPAPQILASGIVRRPVMLPAPSPGGVAANVPMGIHSNPPKPGGLQYLCEWRGCNSIFSTPQQVYHHVCKIHCPPHLVEIQCQWAGCEPMVRKRFSTMTHLHDRHCNEQLLNVLAVRRQQIATSGKTDLPIPHTPPPHPGYAPNAAFHAIKRHALEVISQRDAVEKEGPVTKSIRLTSALVLRNLVIYSNSGRKLLRGYESELSNVAISTQESSRTVAQILHDLHISDQ